MNHGYDEISGYLNNADTRRIADAIVSLCERDGMRLIDCAPIAYGIDTDLMRGRCAVTVIPGKDGWNILQSLPWSPTSTKFAELCNLLGTPGFMFDVSDTEELVLETDGVGQVLLSGYGSQSALWKDYRSSTAYEPGFAFRLFAHLNLLERSNHALSDDCRTFCRFVAQELGGANGRYWGSRGWELVFEAMRLGGPMPVPGAILLAFEWPVTDQLTSEAALTAHIALEDPDRRYANGSEVHVGDVTLTESGAAAMVVGLVRQVGATGGAIVEMDGSNYLLQSTELQKLRLVRRVAYSESSDWPTIQVAAEQGKASAQYRLGLRHAYGVGVPKNCLRAVNWFRQAAQQGYIDALRELGSRYHLGEGVLTDWPEAHMWLLTAADQGHIRAQDILLSMSQYQMVGLGVARNDAKAHRWMRGRCKYPFAVKDADQFDHCQPVVEGVSAPLPTLTLSTDTSSFYLALTEEERQLVSVQTPKWMRASHKRKSFTNYRDLWMGGQIVWGRLLQTPPRFYFVGADVIYDPTGTLDHSELIAPACAVLAPKDSQSTDASMSEFVAQLADMQVPRFGLPVPASISPHNLLVSRVAIYRHHLPDRRLSRPYFPLLINAKYPGVVMVLPGQWWPDELLDRQKRKGEDKVQVAEINTATTTYMDLDFGFPARALYKLEHISGDVSFLEPAQDIKQVAHAPQSGDREDVSMSESFLVSLIGMLVCGFLVWGLSMSFGIFGDSLLVVWLTFMASAGLAILGLCYVALSVRLLGTAIARLF